MESKGPDDTLGIFFPISGICGKCGKKVVGEVNGCNAMEQVFHIACFVCISCGKLWRITT